MGITAPFITMQLARVTRRDFDGKINVVTTVDQTVSNSIEDAMAPGAEKLMCSTRQEMMEAVRKGKADAAFVYYYMAQAFVNSEDVYKRQQLSGISQSSLGRIMAQENLPSLITCLLYTSYCIGY